MSEKNDALIRATTAHKALQNASGNLLQYEDLIVNRFYDEDSRRKAINLLLSSLEDAFVKTCNIIADFPGFNDEIDECVLVPSYCSFDEIAGGYMLVIPRLVSKQSKNKAAKDGAYIKSVTTMLINSHVVRGKKLELFEKADIEFVHHIAPDAAVPDPDNVEIKAVIDCLQGRIITNDTLLNISLKHRGVRDSKSYTEVLVKKVENEN